MVYNTHIFLLILYDRNYLNAFKKVLTLPVDLVSSAATTIASPFQRTQHAEKAQLSMEAPDFDLDTPKEITGQLEVARQELDMLQNYISLETSLQLIHINKESERRIQQFIDIGFPGRMKSDM